MLPLTRRALAMVRDLVAADRAEPREEGRLAPIRAELAHRLRQSHLHDFLRSVRVVREPRPSKPVQAREIAVEERGEGLAIVCQQALYQAPVFELVGHSDSVFVRLDRWLRQNRSVARRPPDSSQARSNANAQCLLASNFTMPRLAITTNNAKR